HHRQRPDLLGQSAVCEQRIERQPRTHRRDGAIDIVRRTLWTGRRPRDVRYIERCDAYPSGRRRGRRGRSLTVPKLNEPFCLDCERLWRAYQRATTEHLRLLSQLRRSDVDRERAETLLREVSAAELTLKKTKEALANHQLESGHH